MKVALLCGGPSLERGISLNSARSVLDHLSSDQINLVPIYFNRQKKPYLITPGQLYSNTPSDFDFKLRTQTSTLSEARLLEVLRNCDIVFPVIHGSLGEDGEIQTLLEKNSIKYIGSSATSCKKCFDKHVAATNIAQLGFFAPESLLLKIYGPDHRQQIHDYFKRNAISRAIVKPASGGSSIGVYSVNCPEEALHKAALLFSKRMDTRVVIEPFAQGVEFTVIILQNRFGLPVSLIPTEIEVDYAQNQIFDFRKKYLPTRHVKYHCPPRFDNATIHKIQVQAEQLFSAFDMFDFARFDGWLLDSGEIWFSDFNPVSGMEQNSFLFQQGSRVGLTHRGILNHIVQGSCARQNVAFPQKSDPEKNSRKPISVLFGGKTSERQVSLMSGTNVWLKLTRSEKYSPRPFLIDTSDKIWELPYHLILNHTIEEITQSCENFARDEEKLQPLEAGCRLKLGFTRVSSRYTLIPHKQTLDQFISQSPYIFNCLHGGDGENGTYQNLFTQKNKPYNGSNATVSQLCMDKWATNKFINSLKISGLTATTQKLVILAEIRKLKSTALKKLWRQTCKDLKSKTLIAKPKADGCSTGVVHLFSSDDLIRYLDLLCLGASHIPKNTFKNQPDSIDLPTNCPDVLLEKFIETDKLQIKNNTLKYRRRTGWIEITVGVLAEASRLRALNPSITIASGEVLSVEEKFQGGTGVNITPPPGNIVSKTALSRVKRLVTSLANKIDLADYARIDAFLEVATGNIMVIEINTLPGLTPSTVIFHQALAENLSLSPRVFLERIIESSGY